MPWKYDLTTKGGAVSVAATSIKIPRPLKAKIERLARKTGQTSHAFRRRPGTH